jgi:hypothetical protein
MPRSVRRQRNTVPNGLPVTLGQMRATRVRGLLVFCADYRCSHIVKLEPAYVDRCPDELWLSDVNISQPAALPVRDRGPPPCTAGGNRKAVKVRHPRFDIQGSTSGRCRNKGVPPCKAKSTKPSETHFSARSVKDCKHVSGRKNYPRASEFSFADCANWMINRRELHAIIHRVNNQ